jgi:hypothetical protein
MATKTYQLSALTPGSQAIMVALGMNAHSVQVQNYTNQYLYLPDIQQYVPPFSPSNFYSANTFMAQAIWQAPPTLQQAPVIPTQQCILTYYDVDLGTAVNPPLINPTPQVPCIILPQFGAGFTIIPGTSNTQFRTNAVGGLPVSVGVEFLVPSGANSITISGQFPIATQCYVQGLDSLSQYLSLTTSNSPSGQVQPPIFVLVETAADTHYFMNISCAASQPSNGPISIIANFGTQIVAIANTGVPIPVSGPSGTSIAVDTGAPGSSVRNFLTGTDTAIGAADALVLLGSPSRRGVIVSNTGTNLMRLNFGVAATAITGLPIPPGTSFSMANPDCYVGDLHLYSALGTIYSLVYY